MYTDDALDDPQLSALAHEGWSLERGLDTVAEASHSFSQPAVLQVEGGSLDDRAVAWAEHVAVVRSKLEDVQSQIDQVCFALYEISEDDRRTITEGFGVTDDYDVEPADADVDEPLEVAALSAALVSWAVGVAAGRFDVRLATDGRELPPEPEPFDPLPESSPAMLTGSDQLPLDSMSGHYPVSVSPVMVSDPGHPLDITSRVRAVFDVAFGGSADQWWSDVGAALGAKDGEIRAWLRRGFFDCHLKTYSGSRRKAPVLWPVGTRSGSYLVWLYAHRVSPDTLFRVLNDLVTPKVTLEEQKLTRLRQDAGDEPTESQRRTIDRQEGFVGELRELREAVEAVTPLWAPDLNDGIVIVLAPLWRLFAHHGPWSKELKQRWAKLAKGDYDWAKLAMHLWPERVIPKCAEDRSIAIAHGLEDVFWRRDEVNDDKWHRRVEPTTPIDELLAERENTAVAAALQHLADT